MDEPLTPEALREIWPILTAEDRLAAFRILAREDADEFFATLSTRTQAELLEAMGPKERRLWARLLPPDDLVDVVQALPEELRREILASLEEQTRQEVRALLAYAEDEAGGLMSPRFVRVRPDMTVGEALRYLRRQSRGRPETVYYVYVLDAGQRLLGALSLRDLLSARDDQPVQEVMRAELVTATEETDQEELARLFARHDLMAAPVVDAEGRMKGIVTVDDIVDVVQEEATEDMQKIGGVAALESPYLRTGFFVHVRKRAGWLALLFFGEMLTASAMARYEHELSHALVLALFVPLIISSGGNSGSQASTLIVRALALGEVRGRDWGRVVRRELGAGLALGGILATIGLGRVYLWQELYGAYGEHAGLLGLTVGLSLLGVVCWGTLTGSVLPMALRGLGFDPASASAPFVATLVDVFGLVIYFSVAEWILRGTLL